MQRPTDFIIMYRNLWLTALVRAKPTARQCALQEARSHSVQSQGPQEAFMPHTCREWGNDDNEQQLQTLLRKQGQWLILVMTGDVVSELKAVMANARNDYPVHRSQTESRILGLLQEACSVEWILPSTTSCLLFFRFRSILILNLQGGFFFF